MITILQRKIRHSSVMHARHSRINGCLETFSHPMMMSTYRGVLGTNYRNSALDWGARFNEVLRMAHSLGFLGEGVT